jgi:hypothetical protein
MLGDAFFKKGKNNNIRIGFKQSIKNFPFLWNVFMELNHYCATPPRLETTVLNNGKFYKLITLETRTYPVFNQLYNLFIIKGRKGINLDLFDYLSPKALAY